MISALWPDFAASSYGDIEGAENVTIILNNRIGKVPPSPRREGARPVTPEPIKWHLEGNSKGFGALGELLLIVVSREHVQSVDVVGLDEIMPERDLEPYMQGLCDVMYDTIAHLPPPSQCMGRPSLGEFLVFLTHQEYLEEVEEERYRLLTVQ